MTLTLQLSDEALSALKNELRISRHQYDVCACGTPSEGLEMYAHRILRTRKILELSVTKQDACFDL